MTDEETKKIGQIEGFLRAESADDREVPASLVTRVLADAQRVQAARNPARRPIRHRPDKRFLTRWWPAAGGAVAAGCAGFWIGISAPGVFDPVALLLSPDVYAAEEAGAYSAFGWDLSEDDAI